MPILNPVANEVFVVRSYKVFQGTVWANNYEIRVTNDSVTTAGLQQAALNIVNAERQFHFDFVEFWKHVISTYVPDSVPYNPLSFISVNTSLNGQRAFSQSQEALPFSTCVFVRFTALTGRPMKSGMRWEEAFASARRRSIMRPFWPTCRSWSDGPIPKSSIMPSRPATPPSISA